MVYKMIWIVRAFWLVYKCVFIALWSTKMTLAIWLPLSPSCESLMKDILVYKLASYIVFLFVKMENNNFIKEIKHVIIAFIAWWKPRQSLWEFSSRWKPSTASHVFTDPLESYQTWGKKNMFYFLNIDWSINRRHANGDEFQDHTDNKVIYDTKVNVNC